jgi:hypothetical protein
MNDAKARRWARWHARGYRTFLLAHLGVVLAFYAVSGTIAYVHLHATMPESVRERGGTVPIWPAILVVAVMTPLSVVWSHPRLEAEREAVRGGAEAGGLASCGARLTATAPGRRIGVHVVRSGDGRSLSEGGSGWSRGAPGP